ncbi:MAG: hypothetical protein L0241_31510, partial [Planctomycetia bacterium]|nr:hypothetical protein [Planctomycetia bacterium]
SAGCGIELGRKLRACACRNLRLTGNHTRLRPAPGGECDSNEEKQAEQGTSHYAVVSPFVCSRGL